MNTLQRFIGGTLAVLFLCSCSSVPGLYAEIGAGYKLSNSTSYVLRTECHIVKSTDPSQRAFASCGGDNPTAHFMAGFEFRRPYRIEYHHFSHFFDGGSDRETHLDEIRVIRKWGGR